MGSLVTRDMLLKHTALALAVFAAIADARRLRGGRKRGNRGRGKGKRPAAAAAAVSAEVDEAFFPSLSEPGSEELFASIVSGEFEDFVAEFHEEQLAKGEIEESEGDDGFRGVGMEGYSEEGFRAVTMQNIMNAGGPEYCKDMTNIHHKNRPKPGQAGWGTWSQMLNACKSLDKVMGKRKAACSNFLMKIAFNPNRKYELKPNEETRKKYCQDITKMKNPWLHCKAVCGGRGRKKTMCIRRRNMCQNRLKLWTENNEALKENKKCRKLPKGMKTPPPHNHPLNQKRKCVRVKKRWVCEYIPNSDLPWCPYGWSEANKEQFKGKGKAAAWGHGKKKGGKPKGKGGFRELGEQMSEGSDQFQEMMSEMDQIENQFGHNALDAEIQKFQNKKKKRGKGGKWTRNSYEEDLALSYVDDDVKDRK